ncbi:hypothetical protein F7725_008178, partial [Dissostichus mawsoni]
MFCDGRREQETVHEEGWGPSSPLPPPPPSMFSPPLPCCDPTPGGWGKKSAGGETGGNKFGSYPNTNHWVFEQLPRYMGTTTLRIVYCLDPSIEMQIQTIEHMTLRLWRRREGGLSKVFETDEGGGGREWGEEAGT